MLYAILPQPYEIAKEKWGLGKVASAGRETPVILRIRNLLL